jgi:hypothetical protein
MNDRISADFDFDCTKLSTTPALDHCLFAAPSAKLYRRELSHHGAQTADSTTNGTRDTPSFCGSECCHQSRREPLAQR